MKRIGRTDTGELMLVVSEADLAILSNGLLNFLEFMHDPSDLQEDMHCAGEFMSKVGSTREYAYQLINKVSVAIERD